MNRAWRAVVALAVVFVSCGVLVAQVAPADAILNWPAPAQWSYPGAIVSMNDISPGMAFVAVDPCRIVDTRGTAGFAGQAGPPVLLSFTNRNFQIGGSPAPNKGAEGENDQFRHLSGHWASGTLEVERVSPRGGVMLQKYKLEDSGKTLEIRMERKDSDNGSPDAPRRGPREFKMVYRRTA